MRTHVILIPLIDGILFVVQAFLGLRIILRFFGANPEAPFVNWIYTTSQPLIAPFEGMFPSPALDGRFVLEFSTIFALIVYALIAYFIVELIRYATRLSRGY